MSSLNLQNHYVIWQKGIKIADKIKGANQLTLSEGDCHGLASWSQYHHTWKKKAEEKCHDKDSASHCWL